MRRLEKRILLDSQQLAEAAHRVRTAFGRIPETAIILGSGLGPFAETLKQAKVLATVDIPGYPPSTVVGHKGRWVVGRAANIPLLAVQGRIHAYEGHSHRTVGFPVHLLAEIGVRNLIITNAAGGINPFYRPGDFMIIEDHINLTFDNPLFGPNDDTRGARFPDMSAPFDAEFIENAQQEALRLSLPVHRGVYLGVLGPSYETAAEIRMGARIGADAVGMSTVAEVIAAIYRGMRVLGISCITNMATGLHTAKLDHADVTTTANRIQESFMAFIAGILSRMRP